MKYRQSAAAASVMPMQRSARRQLLKMNDRKQPIMVCMIVAEEDGIAIKRPFLCVFKDSLLGLFGLFLKIQGQPTVNQNPCVFSSKLHAVPTNLVGTSVDDKIYS